MKNNKGFVMTETLVVTMFLVTIFSFIYVSIVPLMGKYEDMIDREQDIDIVYKLYNLRKLILADDNSDTLAGASFNNLTNNGVSDFCNKFSRQTFCSSLLEYLELTDFIFIYSNDILSDLETVNGISTVMGEYISKYQNMPDRVVILLDNSTHTIAHLKYDKE